MKLVPIALLLLGGGTATFAQDLPQWVLNLARIKRQARANFQRLPDYFCHETIQRYHQPPQASSFRLLDTLHLDVAVIGGKEMYAKSGGGQFQDSELTDITRVGAFNTGAYSGLVQNLFVNDNGQTTGWAEDAVGARRSLRYDFFMPETRSGNTVTNGYAKAVTAVHGSYWADASTFDLIRVEEHAADIPAALGMSDIATIIDFQKVKIAESEVLLASRAEMTITEDSGRMVRNVTEFSGCRQYGSDSVIHFGGAETEQPATPPKKK